MDAPTATAKRKRPATGANIAAAAAVEEVSDAEVEEFYAILRRMRDASRRFVTPGATPAARAPAWSPSFSWEDFAPPAPPAEAAPTQPQRPQADEHVAENAQLPRRPSCVTLDLNAEPEPESPATPRPERVSA